MCALHDTVLPNLFSVMGPFDDLAESCGTYCYVRVVLPEKFIIRYLSKMINVSWNLLRNKCNYITITLSKNGFVCNKRW